MLARGSLLCMLCSLSRNRMLTVAGLRGKGRLQVVRLWNTAEIFEERHDYFYINIYNKVKLNYPKR